MHVSSLGYRTDLIFAAFDGEIVDRGEYLVVRTPANPTFYWGNFLLFAEPPREGDFHLWRTLFAQEIGSLPGIEHQAFGWDTPQGEEGFVQPFLDAGFRLDRGVVLTATRPHHQSRPAMAVDVRILTTEADWQQEVENQVACRDDEFEAVGYRVFRQRQAIRNRKMVESGLGGWYGAFVGERLVADLGVFVDREVGRYQSVCTHPEFRRRGIGGALVVEAGRQVMAERNLEKLVIVADDDSSGLRLYKSLGFQPMERQIGLVLW
jgi:ribosomal protein S18 acetylase RimI-like enzyme